jgi:DNA adenine methylase
MGGRKKESKYPIDSRYNADRLIEKFLGLRDLLHGRLTIHNVSCREWLSSIPTSAPCYLDPPYFVKGKVLYPISMASSDHASLRDALIDRSNWVMSYDVCDEVCELYHPVAQLLQIPVRYSINGKKDSWKQNTEYLVCAQNVDVSPFAMAMTQTDNASLGRDVAVSTPSTATTARRTPYPSVRRAE